MTEVMVQRIEANGNHICPCPICLNDLRRSTEATDVKCFTDSYVNGRATGAYAADI